jgi:hypothetical protein
MPRMPDGTNEHFRMRAGILAGYALVVRADKRNRVLVDRMTCVADRAARGSSHA